MVQSLHDHKQEKLPSVATVADGIAVKEPGRFTFETCSNYVDEIVTVSEDEICAAILKLIESEKMVAEGAGAASVAAVMYNKVPVKGKKTICVVSGGNIDVTILNRVINRGLGQERPSLHHRDGAGRQAGRVGRGSLRHRKPGRQHHGSSSRPFCQPQQGECLRAPCHHGDSRRGTRQGNQGGFGIRRDSISGYVLTVQETYKKSIKYKKRVRRQLIAHPLFISH